MNKQISEQELRIDLAAAFRLAAKFDWNESIGNHFSCALSADGKTFLLNPKWKHFSLIKASDLLVLHADDQKVVEQPDAPDITAWCIHGAIHAHVPAARVVLHVHPPYSTALACLKDPTLYPIDQVTARFFGMVGVDLDFDGMADNAQEGQRLATAFGNHAILLMGNHGVTVAAPSIPEAFEHLYLFERAARTLLLAYASGKELNILGHDIAEKTAQSWLDYTPSAYAHFEQLKQIHLDDDKSYQE